MLTLSKAPKVEKTKKFRVKSLLSNQECCIEVSEIDDALLGIGSTATVTPEDHLNENIGNPLKRNGLSEMGSRPDSSRCDSASVVSDDDLMRINNDREKTIFLRAALQLLDEENNCTSAKYKCSPAGANNDKLRAIYNTADFFRTIGKTSQSQGTVLKENRILREDNIRFGWLKKASKSGTFASVTSVWKAKFVELRHGFFCYEDDFSGSKKANKKNIPLSMDVCYCQVVKMREKDGDCVFELSMRGGSRRLWQAASVRDRDAWINSINAAMAKSPQRFLEPSSQSLSNAPKNAMRCLLEQSVSMAKAHTSYSSPTSQDGAAAPYADEIARYCAVMHVIKSVEDVDNYRHIIDQLRGIQMSITVPVFFVKNQSVSKSFGTTVLNTGETSKDFELNVTPRRSITERRNQAWKDMQRDALLIDGEIISGGDRGAEGVLGALVRHLLDKTELLNTYSQSADYQCRLAVAAGEAQALASARGMKSRGDSNSNFDAATCHSPGQSRSFNNLEKLSGKERPRSLNNTASQQSASSKLKRSESMGSFPVFKDTINRNSGKHNPGNVPRLPLNELNANSNDEDGVCTQQDRDEGREMDTGRTLESVGRFPAMDGVKAEGNAGGIISRSDVTFRLTESMSLVHAREILALSNRTQSGGDTYFCIDTLLRDKEKDFSILTPLGVEADPLEITIDVIEVKFFPPPAPPRQKQPDSVRRNVHEINEPVPYVPCDEDSGMSAQAFTGVNRDGSRVKLNMVSESRRSGAKSAGRRRFFGSKPGPGEHSVPDDGHRSTSKVLRSLFFHNANQISDIDGSCIPSDPHVSLTSQTSHTTNESTNCVGNALPKDLGSNPDTDRKDFKDDVEKTPIRTSLGSGAGEENIGRVMRGCSDADLVAYENWDDLSSDEMEVDADDSDYSVEHYIKDDAIQLDGIEGSLEELIRTSCYGDSRVEAEDIEGREFEKHLGFSKSENRGAKINTNVSSNYANHCNSQRIHMMTGNEGGKNNIEFDRVKNERIERSEKNYLKQKADEYGRSLNSTAGTVKSGTSVSSVCPSSSSFNSTSTSFQTTESSSRNSGNHSPQLRLNVQDGTVNFHSPLSSPNNPYNENKLKIVIPVKLSLPNSIESTSEKSDSKCPLNFSSSTSSPSSPSFSTSSPFAEYMPNLEGLSLKSNNSIINPERKKDENNSLEMNQKEIQKQLEKGHFNNTEIRREKEMKKEKDESEYNSANSQKVENGTEVAGNRDEIPVQKTEFRPPRVARTVSLPVPGKSLGKAVPYSTRNLDTIAEVDPQSPPPGKYYEYTQKMNSAPVSPAKKARPGSAGAGGLRPRPNTIDQRNPLGGGAGIKDTEELNRDKSKRSLMSGIVEVQGGSKELHGRTFRGMDKGLPQKREDSFVANSSSSTSTSNKNFGETIPDVTYVCDSVQLDDESLSPAWGRSRSHSTGTGTTSHVNDSSVSTGSSGFFSRLLATPSKHLRKRYGESEEDRIAQYRKDRDKGDEESMGSRTGLSLENPGYDQCQSVRDENVHDEIEIIQSKLCLRVSVKSSSRYRLCDSNPQEEGDCTWACATGIFQQSFVLRGDNCDLEDRLVASDRLVTVTMDAKIHTRDGDVCAENIPKNAPVEEEFSEKDSD